MNNRTKQIIIFLGTLFVAISFITSYGALNSNITTTSSSTISTRNTQTYFASGYANAVVSGYSPGANLTIKAGANATTSNEIVSLLSRLEDNGSIDAYNPSGLNNSFTVLLGSMNAYSFEHFFDSKLNSTNETTVNASSIITLPSVIKMTVGTQGVSARLTQTNYTARISPLMAIGSNVMVQVNALIYGNGTVANNQVTIKLQ